MDKEKNNNIIINNTQMSNLSNLSINYNTDNNNHNHNINEEKDKLIITPNNIIDNNNNNFNNNNIKHKHYNSNTQKPPKSQITHPKKVSIGKHKTTRLRKTKTFIETTNNININIYKNNMINNMSVIISPIK